MSVNSSAEINGLSSRICFAVAHSNELFKPTVPGTAILNFVTFKPLGGYILLGVVSTLFGFGFSAVQTPPWSFIQIYVTGLDIIFINIINIINIIKYIKPFVLYY